MPSIINYNILTLSRYILFSSVCLGGRVWAIEEETLTPVGVNSDFMQFTDFIPSEHYKCGDFLRERVQDRTLGYYYQLVNQFIAAISNPFPHNDLLNNKALLGDVKELRQTVTTNYNEWLSWQFGWIILVCGLLAISVFIPLLYLLYRCCLCCCSHSSKKQTTDSRYDGCKRNTLNFILAIFVFIDVFAAATLLITGQYGQYGLSELPSRLNRCVDDLNLYKRETDLRIRKLLIDDYQLMNRTINNHLANAGHNVVQRVKKLTGAQAIDTLVGISNSAQEVRSVVGAVNAKISAVNEETTKFEIEFARLRKTATLELEQCVQTEMDPLKAMCIKAERLLEGLANTQFKVQSGLLSPSTEDALQQIVDANIGELFTSSNSEFRDIENQLQTEIDRKVMGAQNALKQIGDDLFVVAETISTQIRQVNFDVLYEFVNNVAHEKSPLVKYLHYGWYASIVISMMFVALALCFLVGLLFGMCGRRPTYYNDDCCVRSSGAKFFSCGIWFTFLFFTVLTVVTAALLFVFGNATHLVCQPLRDPLSRNDIMSLAERYLNMYKSRREAVTDFNSLLDSHTPADVIRACNRNETFYQIFDFDKKYHLNQLKEFEKDAYRQLTTFLDDSLSQLPEVKPINTMITPENMRELEKLGNMNITQISKKGMDRIRMAIMDLDLLPKIKQFQEDIDNSGGRPKAVSSILEQIEEVDLRIARPLRLQLEALHKNLTSLDSRLSELQVPVSSLLAKLQHAQALLADDIKIHFEKAAREELNSTMNLVDQYIDHVRDKMQHEVSSCTPISELAHSSTEAFCLMAVDPLNGSWMAMLVSIVCLVPIAFMATSLANLYHRKHAFPKYVVEAPTDQPMSSFITDTYDTRQKPGYANYSYTDDYHRTYR